MSFQDSAPRLSETDLRQVGTVNDWNRYVVDNSRAIRADVLDHNSRRATVGDSIDALDGKLAVPSGFSAGDLLTVNSNGELASGSNWVHVPLHLAAAAQLKSSSGNGRGFLRTKSAGMPYQTIEGTSSEVRWLQYWSLHAPSNWTRRIRLQILWRLRGGMDLRSAGPRNMNVELRFGDVHEPAINSPLALTITREFNVSRNSNTNFPISNDWEFDEEDATVSSSTSDILSPLIIASGFEANSGNVYTELGPIMLSLELET